MISNIKNRLSSLLPPSVISCKGALALSSSSAGVDGLRWWIDCQSNPTLQFELRLLLFLLEEHVYSGDLWRLVMVLQIEVMQEERLHKIQPQNCSTPACFTEDREFLEDKKDRAQMELSLYSQAIAVFQLQLGTRYGHPTDLAHAKCREWLSSVTIDISSCVAGGRLASAKDTGPDGLTSIASNLMTMYKMLVLPAVTLRPYRLVSTWVEECMEEYYMDDRATERASLEIMISQAGDLSNAKAEVHFLEAELCLIQSQLRRAQTEVELLSDAIQYLIESDTSEYTLPDSQELKLVDTGHMNVYWIALLMQEKAARPNKPCRSIFTCFPPPPLTQSAGIQPHFHTPRNIFGLLRQFFSPNPPSHDPEDAVTLEDISTIHGNMRERPLSNVETTIDEVLDEASPYYPYPNRSSLELGDWYWNGGVQKSQQSFNNLVNIVTNADFDCTGNDYEDGSEEWEDEDAGWHKTNVSIQVPFACTKDQAGVRMYSGVELYHRSLVGVIREKLANMVDDELFHYEPYELLWKPNHLQQEVKIQSELYQSPAFMDTH
ncbi:hypothetical protein DFH29DRAFT_1006524 [Suillus ampliporus]|nr:hypothetical protein DFH29DRAFT_1006524 [Suillus ampliporus]